jgi:hypothetical protein
MENRFNPSDMDKPEDEDEDEELDALLAHEEAEDEVNDEPVEDKLRLPILSASFDDDEWQLFTSFDDNEGEEQVDDVEEEEEEEEEEEDGIAVCRLPHPTQLLSLSALWNSSFTLSLDPIFMRGGAGGICWN